MMPKPHVTVKVHPDLNYFFPEQGKGHVDPASLLAVSSD
jgi:hypothetical protein